jgi:hypothetical protein
MAVVALGAIGRDSVTTLQLQVDWWISTLREFRVSSAMPSPIQ